MKYLYLHGLGQTSASWNNVIKETEVANDSVSLSLNNMKHATYDELYSDLTKECDKYDDIVLCGLSRGAVLALNYALDYPNKVKKLVLIAPQYKMPKQWKSTQEQERFVQSLKNICWILCMKFQRMTVLDRL